MSRRTVALVHERFTEVAGSEQVVAQLSAEFPDAAVHAPIARPSGVPPQLARPPVTTWVDQLYRRSGRRSYAPLLPLLPGAFRGMSLRGADVVVASHHAFATQVVHATDAPVLAYVHSPARWAWDAQLRRGEAGGAVGTLALNALSARTRRHELVASARLAVVVANSTAVAQRIQRCWRRSATVVHPPVDTEFYTPDPSVPREGFVLLAGRLVSYKRPDLAVRAAERAGIALVVAGDGRAMERCVQLAGPHTTFLGRVSDERLRDLHRRASAVLLPGVEDFGIVPVEAMACGTPVLALDDGGATDTVVPGVTGLRVPAGTDDDVVTGFAAALREHQFSDYDPVVIRRHAEQFSRAAFRSRMRELVQAL